MRKVKTRKTSDFPGKSGSLVYNEYITPVIIKYPFWRMTMENPRAIYACLNKGEAYTPEEIGEKSICINEDFSKVIDELLKK